MFRLNADILKIGYVKKFVSFSEMADFFQKQPNRSNSTENYPEWLIKSPGDV